MKVIKIIIGIIGIGLISCSQTNNKLEDTTETVLNNTFDSRMRFPNNSLSELFSKISEPLQVFSIDNSKDTTIVGKLGTIILIPKESFLDDNGKEILDIQLELVEAFSLYDMICNGLSTKSNDRIIETDGMIFLDAKNKLNEKIYLKPNQEIFLKTPSINNLSDIKIFNGTFTNNGVNWNEPRPTDKYLTLVPLKFLDFYPEGYKTKSRDIGGVSYTTSQNDKRVYLTQVTEDEVYCGISKKLASKLYDEKFEKTIISTKEFETRMKFIHKSCEDDLLRLYLNNIDLNLWEIDSLAVDFLNRKKNNIAKFFELFKNQKKTKIKDNSKKDALYSEFIRQTYRDYESYKKTNFLKNIIYNSFSTTTLGWINCDRFLNDPQAIPTKLDVIASNVEKEKECKTYLIFSSIKSILEFQRAKDGFFYVGNSESERKINLPNGEKVLIVSLSYTQENPMMAMQSVTLGITDKVTLHLEEVTPEVLKKNLKEFIQINNPENSEITEEQKCCESEYGAEIFME